MSALKVGVIGFGTVGAGVADILFTQKETFSANTGLSIELTRVADTDTTTDRGITLDTGVLVDDANKIIDDPEIDVVVELVGGVGVARDFVTRALQAKKHVVTANKYLLAVHGDELFALAKENNVTLLFEAAVAGGIPIIAGMRDGLAANSIESVIGIMNGTSNYILTQMVEFGKAYETALAEAQAKGYAEADPTFDVEGIDTAHKTVLLSNLAFRSAITLDEIFVDGISSVALEDVEMAEELGYCIKLLSVSKRVENGIDVRVHPALLPTTHPLANVTDVFNAVFVKGDAVGETMFYGRGAGRLPTASAVVSDIVQIARGIANDSFTQQQFIANPDSSLSVIGIENTCTRYYVRIPVADKPGVMGTVASVFGENNISIASLLQKESGTDGASIVILTHEAKEGNFKKALASIESLDITLGAARFIRVEDGS